MPRLQAKSLDAPDEVRTFTNGKTEIYDLGSFVLGRGTVEPGWRWSVDIKPVAGTELCEYHHLGVTLSGRAMTVMADGTELAIEPGQIYEIPPGHDAWVVGDEPWVWIDFAGMRSYAQPVEATGERILATILFTDIVDSTSTAERIGDKRWRELLASHDDRARLALAQYRGREIKATGDGFLALFDGSARAVRCAMAIRDSVAELGVRIRSGVHTGEVELVGDDIRGVAVNAASRILDLAEPGEVLVSATTHELLAGSGLSFTDRGEHELKGLSGPRHLYAVD
jgi:class 3 adenylate cyclase